MLIGSASAVEPALINLAKYIRILKMPVTKIIQTVPFH